MDLTFKMLGWSGKTWPQRPQEVAGMIEVLNSEGVRSYLEVGCRYGDTFHAVGLALPEGSRCVACDLPGWRNGVKSQRHPRSHKYLQRAADDLSRKGRPASVIIGDSHHHKTVAAVKALAPFDAVFIDGDHTYEGVVEDWRNYGPMARIVAFHDVVGKKPETSGPRQLFSELRASHRHKLIAVDPDPAACGIGVIWRD